MYFVNEVLEKGDGLVCFFSPICQLSKLWNIQLTVNVKLSHSYFKQAHDSIRASECKNCCLRACTFSSSLFFPYSTPPRSCIPVSRALCVTWLFSAAGKCPGSLVRVVEAVDL